MSDKKLIIRLDGRDLGASLSCLLVYWLNGQAEIVVTEERGADAVVVVSREQLRALAQMLVEPTEAGPGQDAS